MYCSCSVLSESRVSVGISSFIAIDGRTSRLPGVASLVDA